MIRETVHALVACVVTFLLCAVAYPAVVWGVGHFAFPHQAEGSLITDAKGEVIGSELIAQPFASDRYVFPRPSAADYKADAASGSNLGTTNPDLRKKVAERAEALKATDDNPAPVDLVTASGAGLDPHVSPEGALYQAPRVAAARKMPVGQVKALIGRFTERSGFVIGAPPRVNVLKLNLALDEEKPAPAGAAGDAGKPGAAGAPPAADGAAAQGLESKVGDLVARVERLGGKIDALADGGAGRDRALAGVKELGDRLSGVTEGTRPIPALVDRVDRLDGRVKAAGESLERLRSELKEARAALQTLARPTPRPAASAARPAR